MFHTSSILSGLLSVSLVVIGSLSLEAAEQKRSIPWWVWALVIAVALVLLRWWLLRRSREEQISAPSVEAAEPSPIVEAPALEAQPASPVLDKEPGPDDLKRIEGIGPKISSILEAAGITTFAQLAATDVHRLEQIVDEAGLRLANPTTWPEQAGLAAAGEWDALGALQDKLKWGRRE
jgi:predicted flap endonuclease-1-like 5' DNA nuclease